MSYEVLASGLRAGAQRYRSIASSLGTDGVEVTDATPSSFGHVELAAWIKAVAEQCDAATQALHDGATGLADALDSSAHYYETTDENVALSFQNPCFLGPGAPSSPSSPTSPIAPVTSGQPR